MKLARNAVFAVNTSEGTNRAFLYINGVGNISPFWRTGNGLSWSKHGEFFGEPANDFGHSHWYGIERDDCNIEIVQSNVTKASDVDFKRALKYARRRK